MEYIKHGLYKVKDEYFNRFRNDYFMDNKQEKRPYYYALKDKNDIIWFIPISSKVDKYNKKIEKDTKKYGKCIFYHIGKIKNKKNAFLIGNMFPITTRYIKGAFTLNNSPYILKDKILIKKINATAKNYLSMVRYGKLKPFVDILKIEQELLEELNK